jgi:RimJ/RimL family protein N-acetyltransferase|tara:strand:+ start:204 stop:659 length:456 start_codon:yes stop_codon:yes gene_type:complete
MIELRFAEEKDAKDIFEWRNDKYSRKLSHNSNLISWENHLNWFSKTLKDKKICMFLCLDKHDKSKIGIVRFDINETSAKVSINLSPLKKGFGYGGPSLQNSIRKFYEHHKSILSIKAEIKIDNSASIKIFERSGFILEKESNNIMYYELSL